jgi:transcriptional regulator with XRE-family HTH domain
MGNAVAMTPKDFGRYLKAMRESAGLTLRQVEEKTGRAVKNGYLSQIESGTINKPSPGILWELASVYGVDYGDLLQRAGHRVPEANVPERERAIAGLPLHAFADLTEDERQQLVEYAAFLRQRRPRDE